MTTATVVWEMPVKGRHLCPKMADARIRYGEHGDGWRFTMHSNYGYQSPFIVYCPFCGLALPPPPTVSYDECERS